MIHEFFYRLVSMITLIGVMTGTSASLETNYTFYDDIAYGATKNQNIDLCLPEGKTETGLMVFIHGGGFSGGKKEEWEEEMRTVAETYGIATCSVGYRLMTGTIIDAEDMMDDIQRSLELIGLLCERKGVKITSVAFKGYSAGGHLALLYAYEHADDSPFPVKFVTAMAGLADNAAPTLYEGNYLVPKKSTYKLYGFISGVRVTEKNLNTARVQRALVKASPITYAAADSVPTILLHGDEDPVVPYQNILELRDKLESLEAEYTLFTLKGMGHIISTFPSGYNEENTEIYRQYREKEAGYITEYLQ